jgi:hypothetical protein
MAQVAGGCPVSAGATVSRSYARGYARVAVADSTRFLEEGASATSATRRWSAEETKARVASAPLFEYPPPDESVLGELVAGYTHIAGDPVRTQRKRNLVATCYRVHGDEFLPLVQRLFAKSGTATNLLGQIRCLAPSRTSWHSEKKTMNETAPIAPLASEALPGLIYSAENRPRFDSISKRRYDRHPSNPDAAGFFAEGELTTARAGHPDTGAGPGGARQP